MGLAKRADATAWSIYLAGIVPFFGFLLYGLTNVLESPVATDHLLGFSFALTVLYFWLHICQAVFSGCLYRTLTESQLEAGKYFSAAFRTQPAIAGLKLLVWPLALVLVVPHSTITSFFQHSLLAPDGGQIGDWRQTFQTAKADAAYRPLVSLWSIVIVFLLRTILAVNLFILLLFVPQFCKMFTGLESNVTRAPQVLINPISIAALCAIAYIGLDPIVKAMFVLRRFERQSETSGDDLRLRLALVRKGVAAVVLLVALLFSPAQGWGAQPKPHDAPQVTPDQMRQAIHSVFRDPANTWNLPVLAEKKQQSNAFTAFMNSVMNQIQKAWNAVTSAISWFIKWLEGVFSNRSPSARAQPKAVSPRQAYWILTSFGTLLMIAVAVAALQKRKQVKLAPVTAAATPPKTAELDSEDANPLGQPLSEWQKLARQYRANGDFRLALRALYLGTLATLAEQSLVSPARGKTNAEYVSELQRRAKRLGTDFVAAFVSNTRLFERSWYGTHPATDEIVERFEQNAASLLKQLS